MFAEPKDKSAIRCERKFDLSLAEGELIENQIYHHPAIFRQAYPSRFVNSIYFDGPDLGCYHDNVVGAKSRHKIRLRWYGSLLGKTLVPRLEFKIKDGVSGWKVIYSMPVFELREGIDSNQVCDYVGNSEIGQRPKLIIKTMHPVLLIRYRRSYFLSSCGRFRLTLDSSLEYYFVHSLANSFINFVSDRHKRILEMKYSIGSDDYADSVSNYFPFRVTKSSKYVSAVKNLRMA